MQQDTDLSKNLMRGRGAQLNPQNRFLNYGRAIEHPEAIDEVPPSTVETQVFYETPKKIVNKVESPDVGMLYSMNPYQGCEHGCIYCYARPSHEYWGFSAGLDFESKIVVKPEAPRLLRQHFDNPKWEPYPIALSGNTDCYQPLERKYGITRQLLQVFLEYRHPVGIITKNALILRDLDILQELAKLKLVHVAVSITSLNEEVRQKMEPRTVPYKRRLQVMEKLAAIGVPVLLMNAPIIPGLTSHEIPQVVKAAADHGATNAGYTIVRLNGALAEIFTDWVQKQYPDAAEKVLAQIKACHGGQLNDSRFGKRMRGEGEVAGMIKQLFTMAVEKHMGGGQRAEYDLAQFRRPPKVGEAMSLF